MHIGKRQREGRSKARRGVGRRRGKRTDFCKLASDLHMPTFMHTHMNTHNAKSKKKKHLWEIYVAKIMKLHV